VLHGGPVGRGHLLAPFQRAHERGGARVPGYPCLGVRCP
jgi:hypothetical protein